MDAKYTNKTRAQIKEIRTNWQFGYWVGVAGAVASSASLRSASNARLPEANGFASPQNELTFMLIYLASIVSIAVLLRSAYMLSMLKGTPKNLAAWGSLGALLCYGVFWYVHYSNKMDGYRYSDDDENGVTGQQPTVLESSLPVGVAPIPTETIRTEEFREWASELDEYLRLKKSSSTHRTFSPRAIAYAVQEKMTPKEFLAQDVKKQI